MRQTGRSTATIASALPRGGRIHEPSMQSKRLVSGGYRNAKKALGDNYTRLEGVVAGQPGCPRRMASMAFPGSTKAVRTSSYCIMDM